MPDKEDAYYVAVGDKEFKKTSYFNGKRFEVAEFARPVIYWLKEVPISSVKQKVDWKELRDKFFKECTDNIEETGLYEIRRVNKAPHDLFEWFKRELTKQKDSIK